MITKKPTQNTNIKLISSEKNLIKIKDKYAVIMFGITDNNLFFIRIIYNKNYYYENLFSFKNINVKDIFKAVLLKIKNNLIFYRFNLNKNILYLNYQTYNFKLKLKTNHLEKINITNYDSLKNNFNNSELIKEEKNIDLSYKSFNNKDFKDFCNIKLDVNILNLGNNNISDIYPLKPGNIKFIQKLYLNDNEIDTIEPLKNSKFIYLKELILSNNKLENINPLKDIIMKKLEILYLDDNYISDITVLEKVKFENLIKLNL